MPVEVRELVIRAVVDSEEEPAAKVTEDRKASKKIVADGLERLLRELINKNER